MAKLDFLGAFNEAGPADLEEIRNQIDAKRKEIDGLTAIEKALNAKLNGREKRASPGPRLAQSSEESTLALQERRVKVARYILANGAKSKQKISESCGIALQGPGCMSRVLDCNWFHVTPDGMVTLTDEGERRGNRAV